MIFLGKTMNYINNNFKIQIERDYIEIIRSKRIIFSNYFLGVTEEEIIEKM